MESGIDPAYLLACRRRLQLEVDSPDGNLARAALWLAAEEYPGLRVQHYDELIDRLADRVREALGGRSDAGAAIAALRRVLVEEEGFTGNSDRYYDARNSFLNEVIERRVGIPITLSVLYIEVGRRAGMELEGVGLPGHFMVRLVEGGEETLLDPFYRGAEMNRVDCELRVREVLGEDATLAPEDFAAATRRQIIVRILNNLRSVYIDQGHWAHALGVVERIGLLAGQSAELLRQRGILFSQLQLFGNAWADLAASLPPSEDREGEAPAGKSSDAKLRQHLDWVRQQVAAPN